MACEPPLKKKPLLFADFACAFPVRVSPRIEREEAKNPFLEEVDCYERTETQIEMDEDPRKFWFDEVAAAKFVLLPKFALDILAIPASSAPVERVFSVAGGKRNSVKGAHLEQRVMWRKNRDV